MTESIKFEYRLVHAQRARKLRKKGATVRKCFTSKHGRTVYIWSPLPEEPGRSAYAGPHPQFVDQRLVMPSEVAHGQEA